MVLRVNVSPHFCNKSRWLGSGNTLLSVASDSGEVCQAVIDEAVTSGGTRGNERLWIPLSPSDGIVNDSDNDLRFNLLTPASLFITLITALFEVLNQFLGKRH